MTPAGELTMINAATFTPALTLGRTQTDQDRHDTARMTMIAIVADYVTNSYSCWANRTADGLNPIDAAANALSAGWTGAIPANDALVNAVLNACSAWLTNRRFPLVGWRVTGWREDAIAKLYWQTAWRYSAEVYRQLATLQIGLNNAAPAPVATLVTNPLPAAALTGNFYEFPIVLASGYTHATLGGAGPAARIIRGDTRDPATILAHNGFQPINVGTPNYLPFFVGHATGDTPSTTRQVWLAVNAAVAAAGQGYPLGPGPGWIGAEIVRLNSGPVTGYIYEMTPATHAMNSCRVNGTPQGTEHIFLAIPHQVITQWWAITGHPSQNHTIGPYPFPAPGAAPLVAPATLSAGANQLA